MIRETSFPPNRVPDGQQSPPRRDGSRPPRPALCPTIARETELAAVVDPPPAARAIADAHNVRWFADLAALLASERPDGIVVATPNQLHVENGLQCVAARLPMLIEKPIADDLAAAKTLMDEADAAGVPILVGHHRRHNPLIRRAMQEIEAAASAPCWRSRRHAGSTSPTTISTSAGGASPCRTRLRQSDPRHRPAAASMRRHRFGPRHGIESGARQSGRGDGRHSSCNFAAARSVRWPFPTRSQHPGVGN
ncbi:Gfo/Idh/MocA family protein [Mesorhizobium sp. SARCC-RB16n]|uniref:Gfo/Idh/MocA family protein n=1 Tax=Mesorhizobium sp. SARCC-RB16n TaxID=2116687 RepID=UPI0027B9BD77|nr:Gfo/Idh/MocA family oxidoreductase [Mesorhizobium sp. SARCC-RB16n]